MVMEIFTAKAFIKIKLKMKKVLFILIIGVLFSCREKEKNITYIHLKGNKSYDIDFLYDSIKQRKKVISVNCFFSSVKFDNVKYKFENTDFDWIVDSKLKNIKEARIIFNNRVFYAFEHSQVGLVYAVEFDSKSEISFKLKSHPSFDKKMIDSLLKVCINYRKNIESYIYTSTPTTNLK
jgi:hypothetical protein